MAPTRCAFELEFQDYLENEDRSYLRLWDDQSREIPANVVRSLSQQSALKQLRIRAARLQTLPIEIWELGNLESLSLEMDRIKLLEADLKLASLQELELCVSVSPHEQRELQLHNCYEFPTRLTLPRIRKLKFENFRFDTLPAFLASLPIEILSFSNCELPTSQSSLAPLGTLNYIRFSNCDIQSMPFDFFKLRSLQVLEFSNCRLPQSSATISLPQSIERVDLTMCSLESVPDFGRELPKLSRLILADNPISEFPVAIAGSSNLQCIDLSGCQLHELPPSWWPGPELRILRLSGNTFSKSGYDILSLIRDSVQELTIQMPDPPPKRFSVVATSDQLSANAVNQLRRIGANVRLLTVSDDSSCTYGGLPYNLPLPLVTLFRGVEGDHVEGTAKYGGRSYSVRLDIGSRDLEEEYHCARHAPYIHFATTDSEDMFVIRFDDPSPADPSIYLLGAEEFREVHPYSDGSTLSEFLRTWRC